MNNGPNIILQPRDRRILEFLGKLRFLDLPQATALASFSSESRARARLSQLVRAGVLRRFHVGTIRGGRKTILTLPSAGVRRANNALASPKSDQFVEHQLLVNSICLSALQNPPGPVRLQSVPSPIPDGTGIRPDAFITVGDHPALGLFVEADRGTESLKVWREKTRKYLTLAASGYCTKTFGEMAFRVLVVAELEDRITSLRRLLAEHTEAVFWLASTKTINREGFWSPVWQRPGSDQLHSLWKGGENNENM